MREALFYVAGAATIMTFLSLLCLISIERARKESEASRYGALCGRIQEQIDEIRLRIAATKTQLYMTDHALDQALLQWKYEYLVKQEKWLTELMCGKMEGKDVQQMSEVRKETDGFGKH